MISDPGQFNRWLDQFDHLRHAEFRRRRTYYLGVQNPNSFAITNYGIQVNFHLVPPPLALPQLPELLAIANQLFATTNSATGGLPPLTYTLTSTVNTGPFGHS